jgi:hypothetical protein
VKEFFAEIGSTLKNLGAINANGSGPGVEFTLAPALGSVIRASFRPVRSRLPTGGTVVCGSWGHDGSSPFCTKRATRRFYRGQHPVDGSSKFASKVKFQQRYEKRHRNYAARRFLNRFDPCF